MRSGSYRTLPLPGRPQPETVGTVEAVGEGVTPFSVGDRVAYISRNYGAYARSKVLDAALTVLVPDSVDDALAAAWCLKGPTAQALVDEVEPVRPGMFVLAQGAGGGFGRLAVRVAKLRGATVIGFEGALSAVSVKDHLVHYGKAAGPIPAFDLWRLGAKSAKVPRLFLWLYIDSRAKHEVASARLFGSIGANELPVMLGGHFPLEEAGKAHAALESRAAGPFVLDC